MATAARAAASTSPMPEARSLATAGPAASLRSLAIFERASRPRPPGKGGREVGSGLGLALGLAPGRVWQAGLAHRMRWQGGELVCGWEFGLGVQLGLGRVRPPTTGGSERTGGRATNSVHGESA